MDQQTEGQFRYIDMDQYVINQIIKIPALQFILIWFSSWGKNWFPLPQKLSNHSYANNCQITSEALSRLVDLLNSNCLIKLPPSELKNTIFYPFIISESLVFHGI